MCKHLSQDGIWLRSNKATLKNKSLERYGAHTAAQYFPNPSHNTLEYWAKYKSSTQNPNTFSHTDTGVAAGIYLYIQVVNTGEQKKHQLKWKLRCVKTRWKREKERDKKTSFHEHGHSTQCKLICKQNTALRIGAKKKKSQQNDTKREKAK